MLRNFIPLGRYAEGSSGRPNSRSPPRWALGAASFSRTSGSAISVVATNFDAICELVAAGSSQVDALAQFGINRSTFSAYLRRNPRHRTRYLAAKPIDGLALVAAKFDAILAAVESGDGIRAAIFDHGCSDSAFYKHVKRTPGARERLVAASSSRERHGRRASLSPQRRYTDDEIEAALDRFASAKAGRSPNLSGVASSWAIYGRAYRNPEFRARLMAVMGERSKRREAAKPPVSPKGNSHNLLDVLLRDDLYAVARKVTAGFDPNDRDDVISELVRAALEGEYTAKEFKTKRISALKRAIGDRNQFASLDAPISGSSNADNRGDAIATPCIIHTF